MIATKSHQFVVPNHSFQVAAAWKEAGRLKDLKIEDLNFQLGQVI